MLGGIGGRRRRGQQRMRWLDGITDSMDVSWMNSGSWWWIGRPGMLRFMRSQRVGHDWATELNWTEWLPWNKIRHNLLPNLPFHGSGIKSFHFQVIVYNCFSSPFMFFGAFPGGSDSKASACNAGDPGLIPGSGRSPGEGNGNPLQHSCLEHPMDGGAW